MLESLSDKRVIISAGASGIGLTTAKAFIAAGAKVCVCDIDGAAVDTLNGTGQKLRAMETDVSDPQAVKDFVHFAQSSMGGIDVLVNNAGVSGPTALAEDISIEDWKQTIDIGLNSQFYFSKYSAPVIRKAGGGSIIIMSSNASMSGCPMRSPYAAAKWALIGLMKTLAMELGPDGIRVNAICPASVEGPRIDRVIERDAKARGLTPAAIRAAYQRQSSLRCFVTADDVANMTLFLASKAGARISGQAIGLDGHTETLAQI
jgi:NAD(P)-dependent dehydrogenase (short-subunit alcohol dehydrogenase family)